ncbi:LAETG motif-containing sortase-dependent surface protein, partial [Streptomyces sp. NPDC003832]
HSSLKGLPETVVAGSGWTNFTFEVSNSGDRTIEDILPHIDAVARDAELEHDYSDLVTVQVRAGDRWVDLVTQLGEGGTVNWFDLEGGQSISWDLRVSISHYVPRGIGIGIGLAQYTDDEACWTAEDENYGLYYFEILPAGTDAGEPDDAEPQTGGKSEITEVHQVDADGELAETGSDSNLPVIATIGGIAVLAGTGVVFTMKRRARAEA